MTAGQVTRSMHDSCGQIAVQQEMLPQRAAGIHAMTRNNLSEWGGPHHEMEGSMTNTSQ
jgi:hypothetical protein